MRALKVYAVFTTVFAAVLLFSAYKGTTNQSQEDRATTQSVQPVKIPDYLEFAGERMPLENFDVKERLDRELQVNSYWHSTTLQNMKHTTRYFPYIEEILAKYGVPNDFKYLAVAESALKNVRSPAGASGIWQFMKPTANYYKMTVNSEVDERYNIEMATEAACKYLLGAKRKFGNWTLAAASYNMGEPRLAKLLKEQSVDNYYDLHLNSETSRYVFRIAAIKEIYSNRSKYGFYLEPEDFYSPLDSYKTVSVSTAIPSLADFAKSHGTTYRKLKIYNPWLRDKKLTNSAKKTYKVKVPYN